MRIKASNAALWSVCAAAPRAQAIILPELHRDEDHTREGLAAHWAAAEVMRGQPIADGQVTPQGVVLTDDILTPVNAYVAALLNIAPREFWEIEKSSVSQYVLPGQQIIPDASVIAEDGRVWVVDFKFGHRPVNVYKNPAITIYAAEVLGCVPDVTPISLVIFQPSDHVSGEGPLKIWDTTAGEIFRDAAELRRRAEIAASDSPPFRPGGHCIDCAARHGCKALGERVAAGMDLAAWEAPQGLTDDDAAKLHSELLTFIEMMNARRDGYKAQIEHSLRCGKRVSGWTLESRAGRESWTIPPEVVENLGKMFGLSGLVSLKAVTPKQAADKGLPAEVIKTNVTRTTSLEAVPVNFDKLKKLIID
jgi:hypothetical protein